MSISESAFKLLMEKNTASIKSCFEIMLKSVKDDLNDVCAENVELRRSLEFSQNEIDELKTEILGMKGKLSSLENPGQALDYVSERLRKLEDESRSGNVRITGLDEIPNENHEQTQHKVQKLLAEKLQLPNVAVCSAFRAGRQQTQGSAVPRSVIARLSSVNNKVAVLKASKLLRGTSVYVSEDVSKATADIRRQKLPLLKQKREEGYFAYFSGIEIIAKIKRNAMQSNVRTFDRSQSVLPTAPTTAMHGNNTVPLTASAMTPPPMQSLVPIVEPMPATFAAPSV